MKERVVLAYSGGLDTSVAIGWIGEVTGAEVIAVAADVGQGGEDLEVIRQRALACGAVEAEVADARDEFADEFCLPGPARRRALHGPLPVGVRPVPTTDRAAPGAGGERARSRRRRARVHRQGQRPGPIRGRDRRAGPRAALHRTRARLRDDPRQGDRVRRADRPADRRDEEVAVLDRPERLGPRRRDRLPRGHLERTGRGRLRLHPGSRRPPRAGRGGRDVRPRPPRRDRRAPGVDAAGGAGAQRPGGGPRRGPARPGRGPPRGHQEPRGVRGTRRHRAHHRARRARQRDGRARPGPVHAGWSASAGPSSCTTACGTAR